MGVSCNEYGNSGCLMLRLVALFGTLPLLVYASQMRQLHDMKCYDVASV